MGLFRNLRRIAVQEVVETLLQPLLAVWENQEDDFRRQLVGELGEAGGKLWDQHLQRQNDALQDALARTINRRWDDETRTLVKRTPIYIRDTE
jgi:hypothetical protein